MSAAEKITREQGQETFVACVPHNVSLGFRYVEHTPGRMVFELPYRADLAGDAQTGALYGGVITTLIDAVSGQALLSLLPERPPVVTLDLRVDFVRPARAGVTLRCEGHCHSRTPQVAYTRATVHDGDINDPIATSAGTFMLLGDARSVTVARDQEPGK